MNQLNPSVIRRAVDSAERLQKILKTLSGEESPDPIPTKWIVENELSFLVKRLKELGFDLPAEEI